MLERSKDYFKSNIVIKFLRFLNLMEPDRNIISISKTFSWLMFAVVVVVLIYYPENIEAVLVATGGFLATLLNYSYRRYMQYLNVKYTGHPFPDDTESEIGTVTTTSTTTTTKPDEVLTVDDPKLENHVNPDQELEN